MIHKTFPNDSILAVHDIFNPLPEFMRRADTLFVDIPYNQSLLTNFTERARHNIGSEPSPLNTGRFDDFTAVLFQRIREIAPEHTFIEVGKEALADYIIELRVLYRHVTFYNATYYKKAKNKCYVLHATNACRHRYPELEDMDEAAIVAWLCQNHAFKCIGDLCMGEGLVAVEALKNGRSFVGTELNELRYQTAVAKLDKIVAKQGG